MSEGSVSSHARKEPSVEVGLLRWKKCKTL